jgi:hypothetical protein
MRVFSFLLGGHQVLSLDAATGEQPVKLTPIVAKMQTVARDRRMGEEST